MLSDFCRWSFRAGRITFNFEDHSVRCIDSELWDMSKPGKTAPNNMRAPSCSGGIRHGACQPTNEGFALRIACIMEIRRCAAHIRGLFRVICARMSGLTQIFQVRGALLVLYLQNPRGTAWPKNQHQETPKFNLLLQNLNLGQAALDQR